MELIMRWLALFAFLLLPSLAHAQATVVTSCGSTTLSAGTSHFVTVDTNGQSCQSGAGSGTGPTSVWSAADAAANGWVLSNGGATFSNNSVVNKTIRGSISKTSGKLYIELNGVATAGNEMQGFADANIDINQFLGNTPSAASVRYGGNVVTAGFVSNYGVSTEWGGNGVTIQFAIDFTAGKIWAGVDNTWANGSNPATATLPIISFTPATVGALFPALSITQPNEIWTIKPTAASQKYAPPAGFTAWDGAGGATGCSQATAYLARATGETVHAADLTTLICGLVTDGVWTKLDALYVLAQQTQADARLNLVSASYPLTGTPTFTAYQGFSAFASTSTLDTGFNPLTAPSPNYTQNSASLSVWPYAVVPDANPDIGTGASSIIYDSNGGLFYGLANASGGGGSVNTATTATKGLFAAERRDATNNYLYQNGSPAGPLSFTSTAGDNHSFWIGGSNGFGAAASTTLSAAHFGASLGSAGNLALYNRLRTYMTAIGVP
jgi:hypothetical protein